MPANNKSKPRSLLVRLTQAWQCRSEQADARCTEQYIDFLPSALQIMEKPPSPHGRVLAWSLMVLFLLALLWACFGRINIVAVAEGKIISSSRIKDIQPLDKGVVTVIHVREGQSVEQGDRLVELDRTSTQAEQTRLMQELRYAQLNAVRRQALLEAINDSNNNTDLPGLLVFSSNLALTPAEQAAQEQLQRQEWLQYQARLSTLKSQQAERRAAMLANDEQVKQLQQTLPLITRRSDGLKNLVTKQLAPEVDFLILEQQRIEQLQSLASLNAQKQQHLASIETYEQQINSLRAETYSRWLTQLDEFDRQKKNLSQQLAKARDLDAKQILYAPVSGRIQQLAVNTIGGVVTEAQILMQLVPDNDYLEVEAVLENKDIGFVLAGQEAEVKINTFNFTRYGVIDAEVVGVTADAVVDELKGLVYKLRLKLDTSQMQIDSRLVDLMPGMTVTAEVKTGKRRLIEFVLSPLLRKVDESVGER